MSPLKSVAVGLLSSLLLLLLIVFGLALTLNMTVLSADFVTSQLNKLDMSSLAEEAISQQSAGEELPEELETVLVDAIPKLEPLVKEQITAAIYPIYDYLKGKSSELDLADTLYDTIHIPDLIVSLLDELDISTLAEGFLSEEFTEDIPEDVAFLIPYMDEVVAETVAELEPWIKEQVRVAIYPIYDYLLGESQSLNVVIPADIVKETIRDNLWQAFLESSPENIRDILRETFIESPSPELRAIMWEFFLESLPPQLAGLPTAELELYFNEFVAGLSPEELDPYLDEFIAAFPLNELEAEFNQYFEEFSQAMPASIELTEDVLGPEIPAQIAEALAEAEERLGEAREIIGIFQAIYGILIGLILLTILGIILIKREVRGPSRILGITFLSYGVLELIGILIAKNLAQAQIAAADMPSSIQVWLEQLVGSSLAPLQILSIVLIVVGAALLAVSFLYRRGQSTGEPEPESPTTV